MSDVIRARCPRCRQGAVTSGFLKIRPKCPACGYDYHPEPGFYVGAMMISSLVTAILIIPVIIALKITHPDFDSSLLFWPFFEAAILGSLLLRYSRILWLHLEHRMTGRLDGER